MTESRSVAARLDLSRWVRQLGWASIVVNIGIAVTGGAVRLTGSGLGCPTWPRCTNESFRPHGTLDLHQAIEFGNRMLAFVVTAVAIATFVAAWQTGRRELRRLALLLALGVVAQAVIGGITVLTDLNPWIVSLHLLVSMTMVGIAVLFLRRIDQPVITRTHGPLAALAWTLLVLTAGVLVLGTVVTGAGPHAGDAKTPRNGLDTLEISQLHADGVFLLVGLTLAVVIVARLVPVGADLARASVVLLVVEIGQGAIGFVQYFANLPELLVGFHVLGAGILSAAATWVALAILLPREEMATSVTREGVTRGSDEAAVGQRA